ncbi:hypothetical protein [Caudoviricetes sp.]|nr:hypothetical protein [Caudoviricetes sp.]
MKKKLKKLIVKLIRIRKKKKQKKPISIFMGEW